MKVILLQDVKKVGKKGDMVDVSDGYGQNFLIKTGKAVAANAKEKANLAKVQEEERLADEANRKEAEELARKLENLVVEFKVKAGKDGKTFTHVSTKQIVREMENQHGIKLNKKKFVNAYPIGALGYTNFQIELYKGVMGTVRVHVDEA